MSPTHDYIVSNASGAAVRQDLNNALAAIVSNNSNATAPATTYAYQWWADTTANQLKLRNSSNDDWVVITDLDGTVLMQDGTAADPGLAFADDVDTGLFRPAANQLGIATSGVERVEFGTTEVVFNDSGADVDFRVEGDAEASLFVVDAGNDRIGIAEAAPGTLVEIGSEAPYVTLKNSTEEDTDGGRESRLIFEGEQSGGEISTLAQIEVSHDGTADDEQGKLVISTNDGSDGASPTAALTISADQTVAVEDNLTVNGVQYPTAGALAHRNFVGNAAMRIDQRNTGSAVTPSSTSAYTVDRFRIVQDVGSTFTIQQQTTTVPAGHTHAVKISLATSRTPSASQQFFFGTAFEANDVGYLGFGASGALSTILSFWVRASVTGTFSVSWTNDANNRSYIATYTIDTADTWEHKTITFDGDTSGTWTNSGTGRHSFLQWDLGAGSNFDGTADQWQAGNLRKTSGSVDFVSGTSGDEFYLTGIMLEQGVKATPFAHIPISDDLARCQRYFYKYSDERRMMARNTGNSRIVPYHYPVTMRAAPNVGYGAGTGSTLSSGPSVSSGTANGMMLRVMLLIQVMQTALPV